MSARSASLGDQGSRQGSRYHDGLKPYMAATGGLADAIDKSILMGPHPLSQTRLRYANDEQVMGASTRKIHDLRNTTAWLPSSLSKTNIVPTKESNAKEYSSLEVLKTDRRKHLRSAHEPQEKYPGMRPVTTAAQVGWNTDDLSFLRKPEHAMQTSKMTQWMDNMELTRSYHILRFAR
mmetsp:Transcript_35082/g.76802  ORF Transcript_35082/g.76802 Transcript_35082/m.76802 type:complete len:178 (+) Transcript_35082:57-590(+)|eukprot:CAMPEP_0204329898 /NCGR_PEP_ID=MMETSP0469-20131031/14507_1 /ASSEMBLY_ACC=CAM_ASM_000384 /TAXON_ID=2969 /ORGANISM="Oxyrrhis marina" /LENGTH=177 /DNA_ID=CAMNT_0051312591 /DNA_START=28 /DNA_END=561 /DNA_ORIENTATION=+